MRLGDDFLISQPPGLWVLDGWLPPAPFMFSFVIILCSLPPLPLTRLYQLDLVGVHFFYWEDLQVVILVLSGRELVVQKKRESVTCLYVYILIFKLLLLYSTP